MVDEVKKHISPLALRHVKGNIAKYLFLDVITNNRQHFIIRLTKVFMLSANENAVNAYSSAILVNLNSHLRLAVGTKIKHLIIAVFTSSGKSFHYLVGKPQREWNEVGCLIGGITKHHALISSTLLCNTPRLFLVNTLADVGRLSMHCIENTYTVGSKADRGILIAYAVNNFAHYFLHGSFYA